MLLCEVSDGVCVINEEGCVGMGWDWKMQREWGLDLRLPSPVVGLLSQGSCGPFLLHWDDLLAMSLIGGIGVLTLPKV